MFLSSIASRKRGFKTKQGLFQIVLCLMLDFSALLC